MTYLGWLIDAVGWLGAAAALYAYVGVSNGKMAGNSINYQLLNIFGALCLIVNTAWHHAYPSFVVNSIWIAVGLYSMYKAGAFNVGRPLLLRKLRRKKIPGGL